MRDFEVVIGWHNLWFLMISLAGHFQIQTTGGRPRRVLLFAAQFGGAGFRHIPGWVVIQRTFSFLRGESGPGFGAV